jgi:hypothetical protein
VVLPDQQISNRVIRLEIVKVSWIGAIFVGARHLRPLWVKGRIAGRIRPTP